MMVRLHEYKIMEGTLNRSLWKMELSKAPTPFSMMFCAMLTDAFQGCDDVIHMMSKSAAKSLPVSTWKAVKWAYYHSEWTETAGCWQIH